jgi:hypothetical protein
MKFPSAWRAGSISEKRICFNGTSLLPDVLCQAIKADRIFVPQSDIWRLLSGGVPKGALLYEAKMQQSWTSQPERVSSVVKQFGRSNPPTRKSQADRKDTSAALLSSAKRTQPCTAEESLILSTSFGRYSVNRLLLSCSMQNHSSGTMPEVERAAAVPGCAYYPKGGTNRGRLAVA